MTTVQRKSRILGLLGFIFSLVPISIYVLWIHAISKGGTHEEKVEAFRSFFPVWLQGRYDTTMISIGFCVIAIALISLSLKGSSVTGRVLLLILMVITGLLMALNLFSIM